jgi:hypothetical protein
MAHKTNRNLMAKHVRGVKQRIELALQEYTKEIYLAPKPIVPMYLPVMENTVRVIPAHTTMRKYLQKHF